MLLSTNSSRKNLQWILHPLVEQISRPSTAKLVFRQGSPGLQGRDQHKGSMASNKMASHCNWELIFPSIVQDHYSAAILCSAAPSTTLGVFSFLESSPPMMTMASGKPPHLETICVLSVSNYGGQVTELSSRGKAFFRKSSRLWDQHIIRGWSSWDQHV